MFTGPERERVEGVQLSLYLRCPAREGALFTIGSYFCGAPPVMKTSGRSAGGGGWGSEGDLAPRSPGPPGRGDGEGKAAAIEAEVTKKKGYRYAAGDGVELPSK